MELRHLRYFVAVAEELNFTRAARRLGISQPPLSLQIQQLEKELDTPLLHRVARGVELTDAGKLLLEQARIILKQVEDVSVGVRRRARGETGRVIVASSGYYCHPIILAVLRKCHALYPQLTISHELEATHIPLLVALLNSGRIDVCLFPLPVEDSAGLVLEPLVDEDCVIVVPQEHAIANSAATPLARLAKETFILCTRSFSPGMHDSIIAACSRAGFRPNVGHQVPQALAAIPMVAAGFGVSIVPRSFSEFRFAGVTYVDFEGDVPRSAIALACRRNERSSAIKNVMKAARLAKRAAIPDGAM
jgi:DNA-binding transcriptional LysR family regulator